MSAILFSSFLFAIVTLLAKILSSSLDISQILFIRSLLGVIFILLIIGNLRSVKVNNINMLLVRGLFGGLAVFLSFIALARISMSSAAMLSNTYPIFTVLFSAILINEKPRIDTIIALLISFFGMFLILDPHFGKLDVGYILALAAGFFGGVAVMSIKELRKSESSLIIVLSFLGGGLFFSLPFTLLNFRMPNLTEWGLLVIIAVVGTFAQVIFTRPFKHIRASEGSIVSLANSGFVVFFSMVFLSEVFSLQFIIGTLLVLGTCLYLVVREDVPFPVL